MKKYGLSIRTKIVLTFVFLLLTGMFLVAVVSIKMAERNIARQKIDSAAILVQNLADVIKQLSRDSDIRENEPGDVQSLLSSYLSPSSFDYIALVRSDGVIVAEAAFETINLPPLSAEAKLQAPAERPVCNLTGADNFSFFRRDLHLAAVFPIFKDGRRWGIIYAKSLLGDLRQDMAQLYKLTFFYIVLDAVLLFLFGYLLISRDVVRPIRRLTSLVDTIGGGDLGPFIHSEQQNEIGKLYHAFARMDNRLGEQRKEIKEYIASLENANRELKKVQEEVIRSEKLASVGRLAAGVAHEIGNPLAAIIGYVELLIQRAVSKEEEQDFLRRIASELQRINGIIRDLLDYSRPSPQKIEGVSVNDVIEGSLSLLSHQKVMRYVHVQTALQPDLPLARANAQQLKQVLINILVNAADAMPIGGDLRIKSGLKEILKNDEKENNPPESPHTPLWKRGAGGDFEGRQGGFLDEYIVIDVEDSGTGIKPEDLPRVFDPFFTTKPPGEGTGLGLAISLRIMESFGGKIDVKSTIGKGTKFSLILRLW
ncbi:MAG: ATP-binding protein [Thermodesulfobacteriota bacterium]|nr:ATP-binding protein [Thermodesulfobacteriota bacterium]